MLQLILTSMVHIMDHFTFSQIVIQELSSQMKKTENVFDSANIAISASNDLKWNALGINMIKCFKKHNIHSGYLLVIGLGDVVNSELKRLSDDEIIWDIPILETRILEFERDSIP